VRRPVFDPTIEPEEDVAAASRHGVEAPALLVNILGITDDAKCYEMVRRLRWPAGVRCPHCDTARVVKQGRDETEPARQRYTFRAQSLS
jgi:hypothetical protein